jgi:formylglycine-generating enzyme required for sulfatase activity
MIRPHPFQRHEPWLLSATFSFVAGCELVAGLTGERHYEPSSDGGSRSADGGDASQAGSGSGGSQGNGGTTNKVARANAEAGVKDAATGGGAGGASSRDARAPLVDSGKSDVQVPDATPPPPPPPTYDGGISPPSCKGMKGNECAGEDCCATLVVRGGVFPMGRGDKGSDAFSGASSDEQPEHMVTLSPFFLDEFEVTVGRFRRYFEAYDGTNPRDGAGENPNVPGSGWQTAWNGDLQLNQRDLDSALAGSNFSTWTTTAGDGESLPITFVTWYEAFAFCVWDGGRLPTEAEWEFAAAGGGDNRLYPWGSQDPGSGDSFAVMDCSAGGNPDQCTLTDLLRVGSIPAGAGKFGQMDLAGSMQEPVLDVWDGSFYSSMLSQTVVNPADLNQGSGGFRVMRGGNFQQSSYQVRAAARNYIGPATRAYTLGIRCARSAVADSTGKAP